MQPMAHGTIQADAWSAGRPAFHLSVRVADIHEVVRELRFPDHHWFSSGDLDRIRAIAKETSADSVVTTEKDAMRVAPQTGWAVLPMTAVIEPAEQFSSWLLQRL